MRRLRRLLRALAPAAALALVSSVPVLGTPGMACADTARHAALVVDTGTRDLTYCVSLPSGAVTGIDLIELASSQHGLDYRLGFGGKAVCRLAGIGADGGDCFGDYPDFWGYWHGNAGGAWDWASSGAADTRVEAGDVDGWSWGSGQDGSTHPAPPPTKVTDVCGSPTPDPTPRTNPTPDGSGGDRNNGGGTRRGTGSSDGGSAPRPSGGSGSGASRRGSPSGAASGKPARQGSSSTGRTTGPTASPSAGTAPMVGGSPTPAASTVPPETPTATPSSLVLAAGSSPEEDGRIPAGGLAAVALVLALIGMGAILMRRRRIERN